MKKNIALILLFAVLTFCLPFAGLLFAPNSSNSSKLPLPFPMASTASGTQTPQVKPFQPQQPADFAEAPLLILDESTGSVLTVPMRDFVLGAVAAEMPASYDPEAMKAQAVAAHTYALALKAQANGSDASLKGAYFKANPSQRLGFVTDSVMRSMWGSVYTENRAKVELAVDSVLSEVLYSGDAPALTCYHAISNGKTEASEDVWGTAVPYLRSVDSPYDITAPEYTSTLTFTAQEMLESLQMNLSGVTPTGAPSAWITGTTQTTAGYVKSVQVCGASVSGQDFRKALGLRSAAFSVEWNSKDKLFSVITRGYGHGVGLSQYGANAMALTGQTYKEILTHYYPGTQLIPHHDNSVQTKE